MVSVVCFLCCSQMASKSNSESDKTNPNEKTTSKSITVVPLRVLVLHIAALSGIQLTDQLTEQLMAHLNPQATLEDITNALDSLSIAPR